MRFLFVLLYCSLFSNLAAVDTVKIEVFYGKKIAPHVQDVIEISHRIYRGYPYLYNGDDPDYEAYLHTYPQSENAIVCIVFEGKTAVGLAAGRPMIEAREFYKQPLIDHGYDLSQLFYMGEYGLQPEYRGQGIEELMVKSLEDFAAMIGFSHLCHWEMDGASDDPKQLLGYIPGNSFWKKLNHAKHNELNFTLIWTDIGAAVETPHVAEYWMKELTNQ